MFDSQTSLNLFDCSQMFKLSDFIIEHFLRFMKILKQLIYLLYYYILCSLDLRILEIEWLPYFKFLARLLLSNASHDIVCQEEFIHGHMIFV